MYGAQGQYEILILRLTHLDYRNVSTGAKAKGVNVHCCLSSYAPLKTSFYIEMLPLPYTLNGV